MMSKSFYLSGGEPARFSIEQKQFEAAAIGMMSEPKSGGYDFSGSNRDDCFHESKTPGGQK